MSLFLASLGFGLVTAAVLAIAAVGFTMQFAVTDVLNLAFGAVMIASAFVAYALNQAGVNVWIGLLAAAVAGAVASVLLNRGIYTPFQRRGSCAGHDGDRLAGDDAHHRVRPAGHRRAAPACRTR